MKADAAIQGLGRTNRTNQAQPPLFRPIATNVKAEKRFLSTIARRLDTLGAITKGQRQTGGQGLFRPEDNLESHYARDALRQLYVLLVMGKVEDAAHEMAHALLHRAVTADELKRDLKLIESQAFRLASAFLLPSTTYPIELQTPSLAAMVTAKERWRVSIKAQIKRLSDLEVIPPEYVTHLYKLYSAKGWSREEPLDRHWTPSEPRLVRDALHLIVDENVRSKRDLLALEFTMSAGDIENLAGLPAGWFAHEPAEIVQLKPNVGTSRNENAEILQFSPRKIDSPNR